MHIGIDIGGTHFSVGILDDEYNIIQKQYVKIESTDDSNSVISKLISIVNTFAQFADIQDIGIAIPGVCNLDTNKIYLDDKHIWKHINIIDIFKEKFNIPIYFDNDVNCAALASFNKGILENMKDGLFIAIGTGIGSGIILNGKLYRGSAYTAGEIGHTTLVINGERCDCGLNGCFERYASLRALRSMIKERRSIDVLDLKVVFESNDEDILNIVNEWLEYVSIGIANACNCLDIPNIVIGGGASEYFEYFGDKLQILVNNKMFNKSRNIVIQKSILLNDAGLIGAAMLGKEFNI